MPFNVTSAARFERRVTLKFNQETLEVFYNAGEKYREYQLKAQQLDQEFTDLQRRLQRAAANMRPAATQTEMEYEEDGQPEEEATDEDVYEELKAAMNGARRRIADNLCTIITRWDLEGDLGQLKKRLDKADQKRFASTSKANTTATETYEGHGPIPIDGAWLDALPLPDEFILAIAQSITENFESGGAGGKGRLKAS
jgi:hypothetical protein